MISISLKTPKRASNQSPKALPKRRRLCATSAKLSGSKVGFPIRKSMDQSLFAAPHGLSQRTTSFIASQRQGIHRTPLRHLIALIVVVRVLGRTSSPQGRRWTTIERPLLLQTYPGAPRSSRAHRLVSPIKPNAFLLERSKPLSNQNVGSGLKAGYVSSSRCRTIGSRVERRSEVLFWTNSIKAGHDGDRAVWWSQTGSNRRPHACKARALPTELWPLIGFCARLAPRLGASAPAAGRPCKPCGLEDPPRRRRRRKRDCAPELMRGKTAPAGATRMVGLGGLEPPTSRLSSARSNQLSYKPEPLRSRIASSESSPGRNGSSRKKEKRRRRSVPQDAA